MDPPGLVKTRALTGDDLERALPALAALRIEVFRAFPYLYAGTQSYEQRYLRDFAQAPDSFIIAAETDDGRIIGCATGSSLTGHHGEFAAPLAKAGYDLATTFYFGESVLLPEFRGSGLGHIFSMPAKPMPASAATSAPASAPSKRPADDPRRPEGYSPLDAF